MSKASKARWSKIKAHFSCRSECRKQQKHGRQPWRFSTFKVGCAQIYQHRSECYVYDPLFAISYSASCGWPSPGDPAWCNGDQHCLLCQRLQPSHLRVQRGCTVANTNHCQCWSELQSHHTPSHKCLLYKTGGIGKNGCFLFNFVTFRQLVLEEVPSILVGRWQAT